MFNKRIQPRITYHDKVKQYVYLWVLNVNSEMFATACLALLQINIEKILDSVNNKWATPQKIPNCCLRKFPSVLPFSYLYVEMSHSVRNLLFCRGWLRHFWHILNASIHVCTMSRSCLVLKTLPVTSPYGAKNLYWPTWICVWICLLRSNPADTNVVFDQSRHRFLANDIVPLLTPSFVCWRQSKTRRNDLFQRQSNVSNGMIWRDWSHDGVSNRIMA